MPENWEESIYPIVKLTLEGNTSDEEISDERVVRISNDICKKIDEKYIIERRT